MGWIVLNDRRHVGIGIWTSNPFLNHYTRCFHYFLHGSFGTCIAGALTLLNQTVLTALSATFYHSSA